MNQDYLETVQDLINELYKVPANASIRVSGKVYFQGSEYTGEWSQDGFHRIARVNDLETRVVLDLHMASTDPE